jgi:hypothetical protein
MLTSQDLDIMLAACSQMIREQRVHVGEHGVAVATTWASTDDTPNKKFANTFHVTSGKTAGIIGDDGDSGLAKPLVDMASIAWGLQYAPRGAERTIMLPTEAGPLALIHHGNDDSCATLKPGETILRHFNGETAPDANGNPGPGTVNTSLYFCNDAASTNDNLGKIAALAGGLLSLLTTGGFGITITDSSGNVLVNATTVQISASSTVQIAGSTIQLGGSGTASGDAVVRQSDLQAMGNAICSRVQGGPGVTPPTATASSKTFTA